LGLLFPIDGKIKNVPNHHPAKRCQPPHLPGCAKLPLQKTLQIGAAQLAAAFNTSQLGTGRLSLC